LALWEPLRQYLIDHGAEIHTSTGVQAVESGGERRFSVLDQGDRRTDVDAVVLATEVRGLQGLLDRSPDLVGAPWRNRIARLPSAPPFLVSRFWLDTPVRAARPGFLGASGFGLVDNVSVLERYERSSARWAARHGGSVVEVHAYALNGNLDDECLRDQVFGELRQIYPETREATVLDERHELRADCPLFAPGGFADRPQVSTPDPDVVLAGDFVRTDLPVALMERAATTGFQAANALLSRWGTRGHDVWSVPDRGRYAVMRALASLLDR
jgi:isorenieratene synthase